VTVNVEYQGLGRTLVKLDRRLGRLATAPNVVEHRQQREDERNRSDAPRPERVKKQFEELALVGAGPREALRKLAGQDEFFMPVRAVTTAGPPQRSCSTRYSNRAMYPLASESALKSAREPIRHSIIARASSQLVGRRP